MLVKNITDESLILYDEAGSMIAFIPPYSLASVEKVFDLEALRHKLVIVEADAEKDFLSKEN